MVIGVDGSEAAWKATEMGLEIAQARGDRVVIVGVWTPPNDLGIPDVMLNTSLGSAVRERAQRQVAEVADRARELGVDAETVVLAGRPADEICRVADDRGADLIVVGAHGWGPIRGLMRGSVTNAVLRLAGCAVLTGPPASRDPAPGVAAPADTGAVEVTQ